MRSRQKKLVADSCINFEFEFHGSILYSVLQKKVTTDLRSGKVTKIKLSALFRTLIKTKVAPITISTPVLLSVGEANQTE